MSHQGIGAYRKSAGNLDCIGQFELQVSPNTRSALGNVSGQFNDLP